MASVQEGNYAGDHFGEEESNPQEEQNPSQPPQNVATRAGKKKRKARELTSEAWVDYEVVNVVEGEGNEAITIRKGKCRRCGKLIAAHSDRNGTSGLRKHTLSCRPKYENKDSQTKLAFIAGGDEGSSILTSWKFSQKDGRLALCEMIILDELPFRFVEKEGFRRFVVRICPEFNVPSRQTIREDCVKLFIENKESLKSFFQRKGVGRVSITTDCWTAINNTSFICVTSHFIGKDWTLHKKIIGFRKIIGHKAKDIGDAVVGVLNEWDLKNILCCTVDNAIANDGAVREICKSLEELNTNILGGKYMQVRCVAHIINLVVQDGLEEIGVSVRRVREAVKWIKASPKRSHEFYKCAASFINDGEKRLCLDVPTRWNSTYLMLESAEPYATAFRVYGSVNLSFMKDIPNGHGPPRDEDWVNVRKMIEYLKTFYDFTLLFSGTSYVTAHLFFKEMCDIFEIISELEMNIDEEIASMAIKMKGKIGKYWLENEDLNPKMNKLLYIAAILDPRQKLNHVETCLKQVYGPLRARELLAHVKECMHELFDFYKKKQQIQLADGSSSQSHPPPINTQQQQRPRPRFRARPRGSCHIIPRSTQSNADDISEMTIYFSEPQHIEEITRNGPNGVEDNDEGEVDTDTFDILRWWSKDGMRYRVLSEMARDILAIPTSTVASESAFSMGGRVLDQFRSSLNPDMVEALICSSDWLRSSNSFMLDEEDVPEEEQQEEFDMVLRNLGFGRETTQEGYEGSSNRTSVISPAESGIDTGGRDVRIS